MNKLKKVEQTDESVTVYTNKSAYSAKKLVVTVPPKALEKIEFYPELPKLRKAGQSGAVVRIDNNLHEVFDQTGAYCRSSVHSRIFVSRVRDRLG